MKIRGDTYFLMAITAMMLVALWSLFQIKQVYAKLVPLILSSAVFILAAVALVRSVLPKNGAGTAVSQDDTDEREEAGSSLRGYVAAGLWTVGFFLGIYLLGLTIAIGLFVFSYTKSHGTSWLMSIILTVLTLAFAYGIFEVGLSVRLYKGLLFIWSGY
jgi:hypothetical protein